MSIAVLSGIRSAASLRANEALGLMAAVKDAQTQLDANGNPLMNEAEATAWLGYYSDVVKASQAAFQIAVAGIKNDFERVTACISLISGGRSRNG